MTLHATPAGPPSRASASPEADGTHLAWHMVALTHRGARVPGADGPVDRRARWAPCVRPGRGRARGPVAAYAARVPQSPGCAPG